MSTAPAHLAPAQRGRRRAGRPGACAGDSTHPKRARSSTFLSVRSARLHLHRVSTSACVAAPIRISPVSGRLLQALGDVDRFSGHEPVALRLVADDHLARCSRRPGASWTLRVRSRSSFKTASERASRELPGPPAAHRPRAARDAEDGHDRVPDELLDDAAVRARRTRASPRSSVTPGFGTPRDRTPGSGETSRPGR